MMLSEGGENTLVRFLSQFFYVGETTYRTALPRAKRPCAAYQCDGADIFNSRKWTCSTDI